MRRIELIEMLAGVRSRGEVKKLGGRVDVDPSLRHAMEALAKERGVSVDPSWAGKRLVRALRAREDESRVRTNPIHRDGGFQCRFCSATVEAGGAMVRDHCPYCLRGLHVDCVPGDRASDCGGILEPLSMELEGRAGVVIRYKCVACGAQWRGRAHPDDRIPPSMDVADLRSGAPQEDKAGGDEDRARTLPLRVLEQIRRYGLWDAGHRVVIAVSGGLDSTVLMEILAQLSDGHAGQLEVASVDHGLRPESVAEVAQVGRRARELGLVFHGLALDLEPGPNLQARARIARRAALMSLGADRIALAHHRNDQAETVLYHLLRGSGATGLRGMQRRDGPWVRPLMEEPRRVLHAWAQTAALKWIEDPSNPTSQRGRLRVLMRDIDAIQGGSEGALARSARLLAREDDYLHRQVDDLWESMNTERGLELSALRALHPALILRLLRRLVAPCPHPVRADQLEPVLSWTPQGGAGLDLGAGWVLRYSGGWLCLESSA